MRKLLVSVSAFALLASTACGSDNVSERDGAGGTSNGTGGAPPIELDSGIGGSITLPDGGTIPPPTGAENPATCAEAEASRSYVGCEFWPTVVANPVWLLFDPAVVVANGGEAPAEINITGPNGFTASATVAPGALETILLKWVEDLKGPEFSRSNTQGGRLEESARVDGGAYHMTSSVPVTAWQFNPIQYKKVCPDILTDGGECRSASNDASLLLPTTAMTGNYRVFAYSAKNEGKDWGTVPGGVAITATKDATTVKVQLASRCGEVLFPTTDLGTCVAPGPGVTEGFADDVYTFEMNAGDVVQLVGAWSDYPQVRNADLSGSVVNADQPVQVVAFNAISQLPDYTIANADHMEETVLPAEVIGKKYIVVPPTTPNGNAVGHVVRIYGNVDGTKLTYPEGKPEGAPDVINAGEMVQVPPLPEGQAECKTYEGNCMMNMPFIVEGDQPFAVASFMVGGTLQMPGTDATNSKGDPSFSMMVTPEQFRKNYTFLAPADYTENFAEVLVPNGAEVLLDGAPLGGTREPIGSSEWSFVRAPLSNAGGGVHTISTTDERGLGLQVSGFGFATSYYYPGGLNLKLISKPPVIIIK